MAALAGSSLRSLLPRQRVVSGREMISAAFGE